MICTKFDQKIKNLKNLNVGILRFLRFKKNLKTEVFFEAIFQPCVG